MASQSRSRKSLQMGLTQPQLGPPPEQKQAVVGQSPEGPIQPASSHHAVTASGIISMFVPVSGTTNDPAASPAGAGTASQQPVQTPSGTDGGSGINTEPGTLAPTSPSQPTEPSALTKATDAVKKRLAGYGFGS